MPKVAFLAQNRVHVRDADGKERVLTSKYGEKVRERSAQIEKRHSWKTQGRGAQFMGGAMLWGGDDDPTAVPVLITGLARGAEKGTILYSLRADAVSGVFSVDLETGEEKRIYHGADRSIEDIATSPEGVIACSTRHKNGSASVAVMARDGSQIAVVTEGDSLDVAPSWIGNSPRQLVFQSQGVGRDEVGQFMALGHATVAMLDAEKGDMETIIDDDKHDHRSPQLADDGTLFCIRRPVARAEGRVSPLRLIVDTLLFPLRIVYALARYLDFFTMRYTGKPLLSSGNARQRSQDLKKMMARGHLMEAKDAANRAAEREDDESESAAPTTWQLIKKRPKGAESEVIAKSVVAFDLDGSGGVIYTDGRSIFHIDAKGKREKLCSPDHVERVIVLE
jgi:hypothetical protein